MIKNKLKTNSTKSEEISFVSRSWSYKILQQIGLILNSISLYRKGKETEHPVIKSKISDFLKLIQESPKNDKTLLIEESKGYFSISHQVISSNQQAFPEILSCFLKFKISSIEFLPAVTAEEIRRLFTTLSLGLDESLDLNSIRNEIKKLQLKSIRVIHAEYQKVTEKQVVISREKLSSKNQTQVKQAQELLKYFQGEISGLKPGKIKALERLIRTPENLAQIISLAGKYNKMKIISYAYSYEDVVISYIWIMSNFLKKKMNSFETFQSNLKTFSDLKATLDQQTIELQKRKELTEKVDQHKIDDAYTQARYQMTLEGLLYSLEKITQQYNSLEKELFTAFSKINPESLLYEAIVLHLKEIGVPGQKISQLLKEF